LWLALASPLGTLLGSRFEGCTYTVPLGRPKTVDSIAEGRSRHASASSASSASSAGGRSRLSVATSDLLQRLRFADRWASFRDGIAYDGRRDYYKLLGYKESLTAADYRARYKRGGIAERIIEAYPRATWAGGASIVESSDPNTVTPFESTTTGLFAKHDLWKRIIRADMLCGMGRYSAIVIGTRDGEMNRPLEPGSLSGPDDIIYINCLPEDRARIQQSVINTSSPRFGLPEFYICSLGIPAYSMTDDDTNIYGAYSMTCSVSHVSAPYGTT
jgi:hypothetical protein